MHHNTTFVFFSKLMQRPNSSEAPGATISAASSTFKDHVVTNTCCQDVLSILLGSPWFTEICV